MKKQITLIITIIILVLIGAGMIVYSSLSKNTNTNDINEDDESTKYTEKIDVDASLATQPLMDAYIKNLTNFNLSHSYTNTDPGYTKLINKQTDLIIVTYPSEEEQKRAKDAGVELEVTPVVNEAFVFFTNKSNPVNSLSLKQIQDIYSGNITNWKDVGGDDANIIAYQRPVNSGSQTGMLNMVMNGIKMKEPTKEEYVETMAGIIDVIANYDTGKNGIGYSYYYYAKTMYGNDEIKFLGVNGVMPTNENIINGTYSLRTNYYMVTRKGDNREALLALKRAMLSDRGQSIAESAGYVRLN